MQLEKGAEETAAFPGLPQPLLTTEGTPVNDHGGSTGSLPVGEAASKLAYIPP